MALSAMLKTSNDVQLPVEEGIEPVMKFESALNLW